MVNIALAAICLLLFVGGGHFAATALIKSQQARQIKELSRIALRRAETAADFGLPRWIRSSGKGSLPAIRPRCNPCDCMSISAAPSRTFATSIAPGGYVLRLFGDTRVRQGLDNP